MLNSGLQIENTWMKDSKGLFKGPQSTVLFADSTEYLRQNDSNIPHALSHMCDYIV